MNTVASNRNRIRGMKAALPLIIVAFLPFAHMTTVAQSSGSSDDVITRFDRTARTPGNSLYVSTVLNEYLTRFEWPEVRTIEENLPRLNKIVSLELKNLSVKESLRRVAREGGLQIAYGQGVFSSRKRVNLTLEGVTILEGLHKVLRGTDLGLQISRSGHLIIIRNEPDTRAVKPTPAVSSVQSGRIAGRVTEQTTGDPLPGVNIVIDGTTTGSTTDRDGYYSIINVAPGTYTLRASFIGFVSHVQTEVRVNIDLTTEVNFVLQEAAVGLEEVVVEAREPIVRPDISASVINLSAQDIRNVPVSSVEQIVGLQAGVEPGLSFRGSTLSEVSMIVDGMSMRDGRDHTPFTNISYTSIAEVQVQTGGFSAEHGNVRSGIINVVTKEGLPDRYSADVLLRYDPPARKYFGPLPNDPNSYWMRPYLDPDVAFVGTRNGPWDIYTQDQYPRFDGWNAVAQQLQNADDPHNLTPQQLQEIFLFRHRKSVDIERPDYTVDASIGGPVPGGATLGQLRFFGSYRQTQSTYIVPQRRDGYLGRTGQLKLTSNVGSGMKLTLQGMYSEELGLNAGYAGGPEMHRAERIPYAWSNRGLFGLGRDGIFALDQNSLQDLTRSMIGAQFTHALDHNTYYQFQVQRSTSDYLTRPGPERSYATVATVGTYELDEAPFGWEPRPANDHSGLRLGGHWATERDSSNVVMWTGDLKITSQVNRYAQLKAGAELILSDYNTNYGIYDEYFRSDNRPKFRWQRSPAQGAAFAQSKLEFRGMVANLGVRLDYFNPGGTWYVFEPYSRAFSSLFGIERIDEVLAEAPVQAQARLSPRVGVSFPVTEHSKFYVNYGHFRQMLNPDDIYLLREISYTGAIDRVGEPNHPLPRTVAYEIGFSQNVLNRFLVNLTGYYKALDHQPRQVRYVSLDGEVDYTRSLPKNYADIRGFEVMVSNNTGRWIRGFANFTYMAVKRGNFGFSTQFEHQLEQRNFERESRAHYQQKPVPEPYARANVEFIAPPQFGPAVGGVHPLGDWHLDFLGEWRAGQVFTWTGGGGQIIGFENNVRWKDHYGLDMRLSRNFNGALGQTQFFIDVSNVLNLRHMHRSAGFVGGGDFDNYMNSLHLSENAFSELDEPPYDFIPGNDRPGDFRKPGTEFVPIEIVQSLQNVQNPLERPLYYDKSQGTYMQWVNGSWQVADAGFVKSVLDNKQYIDMPNMTSFTFFNPRRITFGFRISL